MRERATLSAAIIISIMLIGPLNAQGLSSQEIVNALDPKTAKKGLTRSWSKDRGVTVQKGAKSEELPSVNLYVNFEYNSADLMTDSQITLDNLAKALKDERLSRFKFLVAGHTDSKGSDEYNLDLSNRRAGSVIQYLVAKHGIDPALLTERGYGESQLLDPGHPEDGVNRRVQVVNVSAGD